MEALLDIMDKTTVSATTYGTTRYVLKSPNGRKIMLSQISIGVDSNFLSTGKIQLSINGSNSTTQNSSNQEVSLISNLTLDFKEKDFIFIEENSDIHIEFRVTSGSGVVQVVTIGTVLTIDEFNLLRKKYLGVD